MGKKKKILLLSGLILLVVTAAVGIFLGVTGRFASNGEVTSKLYWNVDRDEFIPELGGETIRKPEADGLYTVRFLVDGELVEYRVEDRETMVSIDEKSALGLVVNKKGIVKEVIDIRDMGVREVAKSFYVQTMQGSVVVANSSVTGSAVDVSLRTSSETRIWNVTGKVDPIGVKDELQLMDCIRAFNNEQGQITDIFIVDREDILNGVSAERYCDHCEQVVTWRMWLGDTSLPYSSGHFRLIKDVELTDQYSMPAETDLILDLNGKTIARKTQGRIISLHAEGDTLSIVDGSEEKTGLIKAFGEYAANGGVVWVRYGTFNLYAGTIDASKVVDAGANGAAIQVNPDTTFNMYGGKIIGGTSKPAVLKNEETGEKYTSGGMGGAIYCQGTINMYKGEITGGKVVSAKDHKGQMAGIAGGNIALISKGTMNMYGGKITGGTVATPDGHGGNISVRSEGAVLNIKGGEIVNGVSMLQGANVASWGTITMTGGTIKGGKNMTGTALKGAKYNEESTSHNIFLVSSKLDMKGGTIGGYVDAVNGLQNKKGEYLECKLIFSGSAKIKGGKTNLTARTNMIQLGKLSSGAYISVNGSGYISKETVASNQNYVHSDYEGSDVLYLEKRLFIGKQDCVCGLDANGNHFGECDGTLLAWQPWTKDTYAPIEEGNWYLLTDVQAEGIVEPKPDVTIRLDLNGKTIIGAEDRRVYSTVNGNVDLTITDLSEDKKGSIIAQTGDKPENLGRGGCVWVTNKESKVTFYGGILDARKVTSVYNGAAVSVDPGCTFTMYGGTINGGNAVKGANGEEGFAGSVFVRGQFFLNGGVIQGGTAEEQGGNIYVHDESGAKFVMTAGKVLGGKASQGGNLSGMGLLSIEGGTVANGEADFGGNIGARRKMVMTGGEIKNGTALYGGNIYGGDSSDITISGGTISGGKATYAEGGNLRIWTNSKLTISNAVIKDGEAKTDGGNIYLNDLVDAKITNAVITGGKASANGGNICIGKGVEKPTKAVIKDTQILEGSAVNGGNVYVRKSNTTLSGNVVILDALKGGNMYVTKDVRVSLDGLTSANGSIGVTSEDSIFATNANTDKSDIARFVSDKGLDIAQSSDNELFYGRVGCMCGYHNNTHKEWCTEDMQNIAWLAWTDDKSLPGVNEAGRYYYLTKDVNLSSTFELNAAGTWGLDLNGKTITAPDRAFNLGGNSSNLTYKITDTSAAGTGKIKYRDSVTSASGMLFFVRDGANVEFYAGTISGEGVTTTYGSTLVVANQCTFTMYGGLILPGNSQTAPAKGNYSTNCVEVRQGTLDVRGGTIEGEVRITTVAGRLKISGNTAKVGAAVSSDADKAYGVFALHNGYEDMRGKVELNNLTVPGQLVIKNRLDLQITEAQGSDSSVAAIKLLDDADGHYKVIKEDGEIRIVSVICVCGENVDGKDSHTCAWTGEGNGIDKVHNILWQPWNAEAGALPANSGYYYLTEDMNLTARATVNEAEVYLDLNGHKATATNDENRVIFINNTNANYSITDSSENQTGAIQFDKNSYTTAKYNGMLIFYVAPGKVNLYGGTLDMSNVQTVSASMIDVSQGEFNVLGGTIKPAAGRASGQSNAIAARNSGLVSVLGGTVYGEVLLQTKANTLIVGGDAKVGLPMDGVSEYGILAWEEDTNVICKNLTAEADIRVNSVKIKLSDAEDSSSEISAVKLLADNDGHNGVVKYNNKVRTASIICVCGENVKDKTTHTCAWTGAGNGIEKVFNIKWQAYAGTSGALPIDAGYYYLTKDLELTARATVNAVEIYLDLNGHKATAKDPEQRVLFVNSANTNYSITDSSENQAGAILFDKDSYQTANYNGMLVFYVAPGKVNLYGGTLDMSNIKNATGSVIDVSQGEFNVLGGTIKPAVERASGQSNAIAARNSGVVSVLGGTVYGEVILQSKANTLTVGGDAKVGLPMDGVSGYGIEAWEADTSVICKNLTADADIRVDSINIKLYDAENSSSEISAVKLLADNGGHNAVVKYNNKVRTASIICVCGENVKDKTTHTCAWTGAGNGIEKVFDIKWQAHTAASGELPGASKVGYYYLTKDYALSRSDLQVVSYLDLNGKTVTATNGWNIRIESENANYAITDSKGNGKIQLPEGHTFGGTANGAMISFQKPGTFTVYGGTIDMSNSTNGTYPHIDIQKGQFVMHGGTIIPVKTSTSSNALYARSSAWNDGIAYGTIQVTGGTIYGVVALASSSNTITVSGNAMIGLPMEGTIKNGIDIWSGNTPVYCSNLADTARVIFYTKGNEKLTDGYEIVNVNGELLLKKKAAQ